MRSVDSFEKNSTNEKENNKEINLIREKVIDMETKGIQYLINVLEEFGREWQKQQHVYWCAAFRQPGRQNHSPVFLPRRRRHACTPLPPRSVHHLEREAIEDTSLKSEDLNKASKKASWKKSLKINETNS